VAAVGGLECQGLGAVPIPGLLPHPRQAVQGAGVAAVGGAVAEVVGPLQAVTMLGCLAEGVQVVVRWD
jgi:hypothetical protein